MKPLRQAVTIQGKTDYSFLSVSTDPVHASITHPFLII